MNETDAVSCLLCLQADEYGSMISVCVPPGRIPPSPERVICRRCATAILDAMRLSEGEEIGRDLPVVEIVSGPGGHLGVAGGPGDSDWDSGLPERADEPVVELDRSEPEDAAGGEPGAQKGSLSGPATDDSADYVSGGRLAKSDSGNA